MSVALETFRSEDRSLQVFMHACVCSSWYNLDKRLLMMTWLNLVLLARHLKTADGDLLLAVKNPCVCVCHGFYLLHVCACRPGRRPRRGMRVWCLVGEEQREQLEKQSGRNTDETRGYELFFPFEPISEYIFTHKSLKRNLKRRQREHNVYL